jgi:hypothetical protein
MENKIPWDYERNPHKVMKVQWLHEDGTTDIGIWNGKEFATYDPAKMDVPIVAWRPLDSNESPSPVLPVKEEGKGEELKRFTAFVNWMYDAGWRPDDGVDYNPHKFLMWYQKGSRDESEHLWKLYDDWIWSQRKLPSPAPIDQPKDQEVPEQPSDVPEGIRKLAHEQARIFDPEDRQGSLRAGFNAGAIVMYRKMKEKLSDNAFDWIQKCNEITSENTALRSKIEALEKEREDYREMLEQMQGWVQIKNLLAKYPPSQQHE